MHRGIYWSRTRRPSGNARGRVIWMRGVGTQGYSGRRVSNTTAVPPAFPFPPRLPSLVLPPAALSTFSVRLPFLPNPPPRQQREKERETQTDGKRERKLPPFSSPLSRSLSFICPRSLVPGRAIFASLPRFLLTVIATRDLVLISTHCSFPRYLRKKRN